MSSFFDGRAGIGQVAEESADSREKGLTAGDYVVYTRVLTIRGQELAAKKLAIDNRVARRKLPNVRTAVQICKNEGLAHWKYKRW